MSQATKQLANKEFYHELTPKQQSVIDAYAERPESTHTELLNIANAKLKESGKSITRSYVPVVLEKYGDIAEERENQVQNGRAEGEEVTLDEPEIVQSENEQEICIALTPDEVSSMVDETLPKSIRMKMIREILK